MFLYHVTLISGEEWQIISEDEELEGFIYVEQVQTIRTLCEFEPAKETPRKFSEHELEQL